MSSEGISGDKHRRNGISAISDLIARLGERDRDLVAINLYG